ncbi:MAG: hypothetical protein LBS83_01460 [Holosporales bacterium]|jgi:hypothetical protein|nr:hypothetical protein [Holosporales bacterium]
MPSIDQYPILEVPGVSGLRIPLWKSADAYDDSLGTEIPDWMVSFEGGGTESTLTGYSNFTRLCGFLYECSHNILESSEVGYYPSGIIWASTVHLVLQNGKHKVYINKTVSDGLITPIIQIVRLVRIGGGATMQQSIIFEHCHWNYITSANDFIVAGFTAVKRTNTVKQRDQNTGMEMGQNSTTADYSQNLVS